MRAEETMRYGGLTFKNSIIKFKAEIHVHKPVKRTITMVCDFSQSKQSVTRQEMLRCIGREDLQQLKKISGGERRKN